MIWATLNFPSRPTFRSPTFKSPTFKSPTFRVLHSRVLHSKVLHSEFACVFIYIAGPVRESYKFPTSLSSRRRSHGSVCFAEQIRNQFDFSLRGRWCFTVCVCVCVRVCACVCERLLRNGAPASAMSMRRSHGSIPLASDGREDHLVKIKDLPEYIII